MISCLLLTAGESLRFGSPKALATIKNTSCINLLQQKLIESSVDEIIVVTGANDTQIKPHVLNHSRVRLVYNKDYKFGQTSSFQTGLSIVDPNSTGFMLLPIDCPFVSRRTIDSLIENFNTKNPDILLPIFQHKRGHPPIFNSKLKKEILDLPTNQGLNVLFHKYTVLAKEINDPGIILSFNTPEELKNILEGRSLL